MDVQKCKTKKGVNINGPLLINPNVYEDERGYFMESWNMRAFNQQIIKDIIFVQDNHSKSKKNVLRGLHYQIPPYDQGKLVRCIKGEIFDVFVDLRINSETFLLWAGEYLNDKNKSQLWIPSGFAHGFLTITDTAEVLYKTTNYWSKDHEHTIKWDDTSINIEWPLNGNLPIQSDKDKNAENLHEISIKKLFKNDI